METPYRPVTPRMRAMLLLGAFLVGLAGTQLYVLTTQTDRWFAWTIDNPLTAASLGAFYWTSFPLALLSAFRRNWADARVALVGVQLFLWLTLAATLLHLDKFHFGNPAFITAAAAWVWLLIYAGDPPLLLLAYLDQRRRPGADPPKTAPQPPWLKAVEAAQAAVLVVVGVLLFVAPERTSSLWPWTLTPLTARATAAWLIGVGFVLVTAIGEDDLPRLRVAGVAYVALGVFQAGALARYPEAVDWSSPKLWAFLVVLGSILLVGGYIWARSGPSADVEPPVIGRRLMG